MPEVAPLRRRWLLERDKWEFATGDVPQGSGFLLGHIVDVVSSHEPGRSRIVVDRVAHIDLPNLWGGERSPILYRDLKDFSIDADKLTWLPVTPPKLAEPLTDFSIDVVRARIAKHYEVPVERVSISIRL